MAASLGRTLAVRFSLTMAVALVGMALWSYFGVRDTLRDQLDRSLRTTFELQALALASNSRMYSLPPSLDEERFVREINRLVVGRDADGRVLQAHRSLAADLGLDTAAFRRALAGEQSFSDATWRGRKARAMYGPAPPGVQSVAVLQVAATLEPLERASRSVLYRMIATALLGSLASLIGAAWLARSALAPVHDIATQARSIQGGRSGQRITVHAGVTELQGLIEVLNQMLERLDRSWQWHRQIIRDLGHDLRTPISTLRAAVEMALVRERSPGQYRQVLVSTLEEAERLELISEAMSLLARLESGDLAPAMVQADVAAVARDAVKRARERGQGKTVRLSVAPDGLPAKVDPQLLGMALDQLLDNVARHTPAGTLAEVAASAAGDAITLTVEDNGPGVPEEMLPHLFNRFYRGDPARGRGAGAGLGLTVAAAVVDLHAGSITAERGAGGGLRIRIELPRTLPPPVPPPRA
jgi:heavy metal sensor kinase